MSKTETLTLRCYGETGASGCTAICVDFDIAAQGATLDEAREILDEMIRSYLEAVIEMAEPDRNRLLNRKAPFWVRLKFSAKLFYAMMFARGPGPDRIGYVSHTACPA